MSSRPHRHDPRTGTVQFMRVLKQQRYLCRQLNPVVYYFVRNERTKSTTGKRKRAKRSTANERAFGLTNDTVRKQVALGRESKSATVFGKNVFKNKHNNNLFFHQTSSSYTFHISVRVWRRVVGKILWISRPSYNSRVKQRRFSGSSSTS